MKDKVNTQVRIIFTSHARTRITIAPNYLNWFNAYHYGAQLFKIVQCVSRALVVSNFTSPKLSEEYFYSAESLTLSMPQLLFS